MTQSAAQNCVPRFNAELLEVVMSSGSFADTFVGPGLGTTNDSAMLFVPTVGLAVTTSVLIWAPFVPAVDVLPFGPFVPPLPRRAFTGSTWSRPLRRAAVCVGVWPALGWM